MVAFEHLPHDFFSMLKTFIAPVPRCVFNMRTTCRFADNNLLPFIVELIQQRVFLNHLHIQTRISTINAMARFICKGKLSCRSARRTFRFFFYKNDNEYKKIAVKLLYDLSKRFSYYIILKEFFSCRDKDDFIRIIHCDNFRLDPIGVRKRDATSCNVVHRCLDSASPAYVIVALNILKNYIHLFNDNIIEKIQDHISSDSIDVRNEAISLIQEYRCMKV